MPIIAAEGLFNGDRFDMISDEARLYWPHFWCASNTLGRLEINYPKLTGQIFRRFKNPPTQEKLQSLITQYNDAYLLFLYTHRGQLWGQWDTSEKLLPRYKPAADERSPAPVLQEFNAWKERYITEKIAKSIAYNNFGNVSETFPKDCETFQKVSARYRYRNRNRNRSGKEREAETKPENGSRLSLSELPPDWSEWATAQLGWSADRNASVFCMFRDYWISKPGAAGRKSDWSATWRNWCRREKDQPALIPPGREYEGATARSIRAGLERIQKNGRL